VEGNEVFNWGSKSDYCKTLAGIANNRGGYILFGVKDGSFEITGIPPDRMERFDLKKANEYIVRTFNQSFELDKGQFQIAGRTIGVLYVAASKAKPVICCLDGNGLFSGDIYYRYRGETRRIQAPELDALLKERDTSAENRLLHLQEICPTLTQSRTRIRRNHRTLMDGATYRWIKSRTPYQTLKSVRIHASAAAH